MFKGWASIVVDVPEPYINFAPLEKLKDEFWPALIDDHKRLFCYLRRLDLASPPAEFVTTVSQEPVVGVVAPNNARSPGDLVVDMCNQALALSENEVYDLLFH